MTMETNVLTLPIADSASTTRAPAVLAESAARTRDLRRELADAIANRQAAEQIAAAAKRIADRAASAEADAGLTVDQLRRELDASGREATMAHAEACTEAFRRGEALPPAPSMPPTDSAALGHAMACLRALHVSARDLAAEYDAARDSATAAANACREIIDAILLVEASTIAAEAIAAIELHWRAIDKLKGLILIDEARADGPRLRDFQEDLLERIDRRKAAVCRDPLYIEQHHWSRYLNELSEAQRVAWMGYQRRLMQDATATFDDTKEGCS